MEGEPVAVIIGYTADDCHRKWTVQITDEVWKLAKRDEAYPWYWRLPVYAAPDQNQQGK